jgi:hypothetical protein
MFHLITPPKKTWQEKVIANYKAKVGKSPFYGDAWVILSIMLRKKYKKCQWCDKHFNQKALQVHHIGCVKFNLDQKLDERILLVVCETCHEELEPWSRINLTQMLPQLFEI